MNIPMWVWVGGAALTVVALTVVWAALALGSACDDQEEQLRAAMKADRERREALARIVEDVRHRR